MRTFVLAALLTAPLSTAALAVDAPAAHPEMAAHAALYKLTLDNAHRGDVIGASGSMAYDVEDACDGWVTRQTLDMTITNKEGQDIRMVSDYATWEAKDGLSFRFHMRQTTEQAVTSQVDGEASLTGTGQAGTAHYTSPHDTTKPLPAGTLFPMAHTVAIIEGAHAGKKNLAIPLFDGTVESGAQDSSIVVVKSIAPESARFPVLSPLPSARVHLAFFDRAGKSQTPDYEVGMRYWDDGIADDLAMNFGDFTMIGKIDTLQPKPHRC